MVASSSLAHPKGLLEPRRLSKELYLWDACIVIYGFSPMKPYMCMHGMLNPKTYIWMRDIYGLIELVSSSERSIRTSSAQLRIGTIYGLVDPKHIHGTSPLLYSCLVFMAVF